MGAQLAHSDAVVTPVGEKLTSGRQEPGPPVVGTLIGDHLVVGAAGQQGGVPFRVVVGRGSRPRGVRISRAGIGSKTEGGGS